jgi:serine/threonine-protein kinase RsbW
LSTKTYSKIIRSNPELLPEVEDFINKVTSEIDLDITKKNNLALSIAEAASNAIMHGNKGDAGKKVKIFILIDKKKIRISIKDQGKGFKLSEVPDPTSPENILKDHGRGIHIMKTFLDEMYYNFSSEGTELVMVMNLK